MPKFKLNLDIKDSVVIPTQNQMDQWTAAELAEAEQDNMLSDETPSTLFSESTTESID